MNPLRCIVVDDEYGAIEVLENYIAKVPWLTHEGSFSDPLEALNYLSHHATDLVFLDINMPDLGGLQLARLIQKQGVAIIFCTAYSQHAVESYELNALDYLMKPVPFDRFLAAIEKLKQTTSPQTDTKDESTGPGHQIFVKSGSQIHQIDTREISTVEKDGHYVIFRMGGKELLSRMTFSQLMDVLPTDKFIQIHRSYVVSIERIERIQKQFVRIDSRELPVGDAYKEEFFKRINYHGS